MTIKFNIRPLKGFEGAVAYNAFAALMMRLTQSVVAADLIKDELKSGDLKFGSSPTDTLQVMIDNLRLLKDDNPMKKAVWFDVLKVVDNSNPSYLDLLKLVEDPNGIQITSKNSNNYTAGQIHEMLYKCFCTCLDHETEVFF
jgi:hypothetical protein